MNFTKPIIDLAKEIRRRAPSELKTSLKLANPDLFQEFSNLYQQTSDAVLKALIKEVCELAGPPWDKSLSDETDKPPEGSVRTYRGQIQLIPKEPLLAPKKTTKAKRIYRGQVIND